MMKILDFLFYIALCLIAGIALFLCNMNEDMYFRLSYFDGVQKHEIYEKEQWEIQANSVITADITQIDPSHYLISYLDSSKGAGTLYGTLFYPNKYSVALQKGGWQNIATNTKIHSRTAPIFDLNALSAQTAQRTTAFNAAFMQNKDSSLYVFVNANITHSLPLQKSYIFHANMKDIRTYIEAQDSPPHSLESQDTNKSQDTNESRDTKPLQDTTQSQKEHDLQPRHATNKEPITPLLQLYEQPALSIVENLNSSLSHKPTMLVDSQNEAQGYILPFQTRMKNTIAFFGIFDENLHLQEIVKPHDNKHYTNPLITPLHANYALNAKSNETNTHHCLAVYHAPIHTKNSQKDSNIAYQTCKMSNGVLQFDELQEGSLKVGHALSLAAFGNYVVLFYTKNRDTTLNIAVWNGGDFIPLKELDRNTKGRIVGLSLFIHGAYMYVVYVKESQHIMNAITLNEVFIDNLIAQKGSFNGAGVNK